MQSFLPAFWATFRSVVDIFVVVAIAGLLVRRKVVTQAHVSGISAVTVNVFLPALIFSNLVRTFDPGALSFWWAVPLASVAMSVVGFALAWLVFHRMLPGARNLLPLVAMQNAGYLVLPVGLRLFPAEFDTFALYTFLFIMGLNPLLWSLGPLLASNRGAHAGWRGLATPPLVASIAGIVCAATHIQQVIPRILVDATTLMGQAAVPVATFALGAILGGVPCCLKDYGKDALRVAVLKLGVLPAVVMAILVATGIHHRGLLAEFLVIQAASAPATGLILQVRTYGGDERKIGSIMLVCYALCAVTLPLCVVIWRMVAA